MRTAYLLLVGVAASGLVFGQTNLSDSSNEGFPPGYVPGTTFQTANPNYPTRNPFYFEGRIDWNLLKITTPATAWEFDQRAIHEQDDLLDVPDAINDYQTALSMNSLSNNTCQLVTAATTNISATLNPPPCMFTPRLRLGVLLMATQPAQSIGLFQQVLQIDPLRLGVNSLIGQTYVLMAQAATNPTAVSTAYSNAIAAYTAELALSPVTAAFTAVTADLANNAHVHWALSEIYRTLGQSANEMSELNLYLEATQWHSDTYQWHIQLANARLRALQPGNPATAPGIRPGVPSRDKKKTDPVLRDSQ